jgi:uncharacterized ion transporter superfamily protein YfcC
MIILGSVIGVTAATVNPFSIGVASGEAGVGIGDGIALRLLLWVLLTSMAVGWVLRYAARVRADKGASLVGFEDAAPEKDATAGETLSATQKWVLVITALAFGLMIFSVIPWSSIFAGSTSPADDYLTHTVAEARPFWFELNWWFPQLAMLFIIASALVGLVARMNEKEIVRLIAAGAADMMNPAMVMLLAGGVSAIMTNTQILDTILHAMERLITGASAASFAVAAMLVNLPLAFLIPSSSGHAALAMPLLAPLADFAEVSRQLVITAWVMGHGFALLVSPTSVVLVGGLAIAKVDYGKYLRFVWPLLAAGLVIVGLILAIAATAGIN